MKIKESQWYPPAFGIPVVPLVCKCRHKDQCSIKGADRKRNVQIAWRAVSATSLFELRLLGCVVRVVLAPGKVNKLAVLMENSQDDSWPDAKLE